MPGTGDPCAATSACGDLLGAEGVHLGASSAPASSQMQFFPLNPMWFRDLAPLKSEVSCFFVFNRLHCIPPFSVMAKARCAAGKKIVLVRAGGDGRCVVLVA